MDTLTSQVEKARDALTAAEAALEPIDARIADLYGLRAEARALVEAYSRRSDVWPFDDFYGTSRHDAYGRQLATDVRSIVTELAKAQEERQTAWRARNAAERDYDAWKSAARRAAKEPGIAASVRDREREKDRRAKRAADRKAAIQRQLAEGQPGLTTLRARLSKTIFGAYGSRFEGRS